MGLLPLPFPGLDVLKRNTPTAGGLLELYVPVGILWVALMLLVVVELLAT